VIRSDGELGGYNKGKDEKRKRLKDEGVILNYTRRDEKCLSNGVFFSYSPLL